MNGMIIRQGDVMIRSVASLPEGVQEKRRAARGIVLAEGEVTGHAHAITSEGVAWYTQPDNPLLQWVVVEEAAVVTHEEHAPVTLPSGVYVVDIQVQYEPGAIRRVLD